MNSTSSATNDTSTMAGLMRSRYTSAEYEYWSVNWMLAVRPKVSSWTYHSPGTGQEALVPDDLAVLADALAVEYRVR